MPDQLMPDGMAATIADLNRRLQILETAQRVGLNQLRYVRSTAAASPTTYDAAEYGAAGNTWLDDQGNTGTGYPTINMTTPSRALLMIGYRPVDVGNAAGFKSHTVQVFVSIDSAGAYINRQYYQANIDRNYVPVFSAGVIELTPGDHTFQIGANWLLVNPAGGTAPLLSDAYMVVLPLSAA